MKDTQTQAKHNEKVSYLTFVFIPAKVGSAETPLDCVNDLCICLQQLYLASIPGMLQFVLSCISEKIK